MDVIKLLDEAYGWAGAQVAEVRPEDLDLATPCAEWNLRQLLNHFLGALDLHTDAVLGKQVRPEQSAPELDRIGADPGMAFRAMADKAMAVWHEPSVLGRECVMPFGPAPVAMVAELHLLEVVVHGWDVATAVGADTRIPPVLIEPVAEFGRGFAEGLRGVAFGAELPGDGSPQDRLLGLLGRAP